MRCLLIKSDSQVVTLQVQKEYQAREPELAEYLRVVRNLERKFHGFTIMHIPRMENEHVDALAKVASQGNLLPSEFFFRIATATNAAGTSREVTAIFSEDWCSPIIMFLEQQYTPKDHTEMHRLQQRCGHYQLVDGTVYKVGMYTPLL